MAIGPFIISLPWIHGCFFSSNTDLCLGQMTSSYVIFLTLYYVQIGKKQITLGPWETILIRLPLRCVHCVFCHPAVLCMR